MRRRGACWSSLLSYRAVLMLVIHLQVFSSDTTTWWSPDASKLAFLSFDEELVPEYEFPIYNTEWATPGAQPYPAHTVMRYPKVRGARRFSSSHPSQGIDPSTNPFPPGRLSQPQSPHPRLRPRRLPLPCLAPKPLLHLHRFSDRRPPRLLPNLRPCVLLSLSRNRRSRKRGHLGRQGPAHSQGHGSDGEGPEGRVV